MQNVSSILRPQKEKHWLTLLLGLLTATAFFLPFILQDQGYFLFYGDFNVQQIPFYQMCHAAVKSGDIFWNWETDLGVNFMGSYSFYLLGSPFFWLTLPFPNWMVPYLMGPLLILKFGLSAFTAYFYIRRFTRYANTAMLGALLYAFSGFSVYNIFFNHFHDAIIFFPLLLLGMEYLLVENRRGIFALAVCICAVSNYFFFYGMVVFAIIYWVVRSLTKKVWRQKPSRFFWMLFEAVLGVAMGAALLLPSFFAVIQNARLESISYGWNALMYGKEQIYANILQCFFFPPDIPARPVFFPGADVKWSSLGGWLPLFGMTGVIAWLQAKKGSWLRRVICIMIFMALVPILNSAFYMFNSAYYARWFYMPILMMCVATAMALEDRSINWNSAWRWSFGITLAASLVIGLFPSQVTDGKIEVWGVYTEPKNQMYLTRFWVTCAIAVVCSLLLFVLLRALRKNPKFFYRTSIAVVCIISVVYAGFFIHSGKAHAYTDEVMIDHLLQGNVTLPDPDTDSYRVDIYEGVDNTGMYLGLQSINAFHSIVPASVTKFWEYVGEDRGVASRPTTESYAARSLLSVKYLLNRESGGAFETDGSPRMPGYTYVKNESGYRIYENQNYIPFGFTYDYYMTDAECSYYGESNRALMMLKALLLTDEQVEKYDGILQSITEKYAIYEDEYYQDEYYDEEYYEDDYPADESDNAIIEDVEDTSDASDATDGTSEDASTDAQPEPQPPVKLQPQFDDNAFALDCALLAQSAAHKFSHDNNGFSASITLGKENLVFFSVPYEEGWSATVNGQPAHIEQVNAGFMAVLAPAGTNDIRFTYKTPGFAGGVLITIVALVLFVIYVAVYFILSRRRQVQINEYPEREALEAQWAVYDEEDAALQSEPDSWFDEDTEAEAEEFVLGSTPKRKTDRKDGGFVVDDSFLEELEQSTKQNPLPDPNQIPQAIDFVMPSEKDNKEEDK